MGLLRENEPPEEPWVRAGENEGTPYENDQQRRTCLDPATPQAQGNGEGRAYRSPQERHQEDHQSHGDAEDQERLKARKEPANPDGVGCDRSQERGGSTGAYCHETRTEQVAPKRCGLAKGLLPHTAAQSHDPAY